VNKKTGLYILLIVALLISAGLSMGLGAVQIPLKEVVVILGKKNRIV